jgi:hypothetical protein
MNRVVAMLGPLAVVVALTACAEQGNWTSPGSPDDDRMRTDNAYCRMRATEAVEREAGLDQRATGIPSPETSRTVEGSFARMEVERMRRDVYDRCMADRGYIRGTSE